VALRLIDLVARRYDVVAIGIEFLRILLLHRVEAGGCMGGHHVAVPLVRRHSHLFEGRDGAENSRRRRVTGSSATSRAPHKRPRAGARPARPESLSGRRSSTSSALGVPADSGPAAPSYGVVRNRRAFVKRAAVRRPRARRKSRPRIRPRGPPPPPRTAEPPRGPPKAGPRRAPGPSRHPTEPPPDRSAATRPSRPPEPPDRAAGRHPMAASGRCSRPASLTTPDVPVPR
jgi:hypothetical protein